MPLSCQSAQDDILRVKNTKKGLELLNEGACGFFTLLEEMTVYVLNTQKAGKKKKKEGSNQAERSWEKGSQAT